MTLVAHERVRTKFRAQLVQHEAKNGENRYSYFHMNYIFAYWAPDVLRENESLALDAARHRGGCMGG